MSEEKTLWNMEIGDSLTLGDPVCEMIMIRVPGGWIYETSFGDHLTSCFFPYAANLNYLTKE